MKAYIGIDVSKDSLDCSLIGEAPRAKHRKFANSESGFKELVNWVQKYAGLQDRHYCLESTGCYSFGIAACLADQGFAVSVENPRHIKHFAIAANLKTKTDKVDAFCIARYAQVFNPREWVLKDPNKRELAMIQTRIRQLDKASQAERSRLEDKYLSEFIRAQILAHIASIEELVNQAQGRVRKLMQLCDEAKTVYLAVTGINGIGPECGLLLATMDIQSFEDAQAVPVYFGLNPRIHQSGKYMGQTRISKQGDSAGRRILTCAANAAVRTNQVLKNFYDALCAKGLKHKQAIAAVARKLVMIAWAIARNTLKGLPVFYQGGELRGKNLKVYCQMP